MTYNTEFDAASRMLYASAVNIMGTRLDIIIVGLPQEQSATLCSQCLDATTNLERLVSLYIPDSETSTINRAEPLSLVAVSDRYRSILTLAADLCRRTCGTFDITLGQKSQFDFTESGELIIPSQGLKIDMGGLAKGIAVETMTDILTAGGATSAFISFGGSSIAGIGSHPSGNCWRVSIADPFSGQTLRCIDLVDSSLSTSGNSSALRGHIIDPATGISVTGRRLSAVAAPSAIEAEALSTAWLVADRDSRAVISKNFTITEEYVFN